MPIEATVDLSAALGQTRYQGKRRTCVAFAMSDLNQFHNHCPEWLSPEHLYCSAAKITAAWIPHWGMAVDSGIRILKHWGQPTEQNAPYANSEPTQIPPTIPASQPPLYKYEFVAVRPSAQYVIDRLTQGAPVGLLTMLTHSFFYPANGTVAFSPQALDKSHHAVIACGHGADADTGNIYIKLRNSWGSGWGQGGHAWIPAAYVDQHSLLAF